jgi:hypothetical protein
MSIIAHDAAPEQDAFAISTVITVLRRESAVFEDNARRNNLANRDLQQRIINQFHATINGLQARLDHANDERTEAAA